MAVRAEFDIHNELIHLDLYPGQRRLRVTADPGVPGYEQGFNVWFYWDGDLLEQNEREFLGVEVGNIEYLTEADLVVVEQLDLPRIDVPEGGLHDVTVADALRWAKAHFPSRLKQPSTQP